MCGLAGIFDPFNVLNYEFLKETTKLMSNKVRHRGPDSDGLWSDSDDRISIGHQRLSIIDLSANGSQPMVSSNKRYVIAYNGEIYNNETLRKELKNKNVHFKGNSDTETLIEAINFWGLEQTLHKLIGMYAFALWDRESKILKLVRDRIGIKPLYWGKIRKFFAFSSELSSFKEIRNTSFSINRNALTSLLKYNYIKSPMSIYENIYKLEPGCILTIDKNGNEQTERYWDIHHFYENKAKKEVLEEKIYEIENLISDSVKLRMISDVPIGTFLSGGIDSSLVTALMQENSKKPINTFTIGFDKSDFNEASHAKKIAKYLGTKHTEHYITEKNALDIVYKLPHIYDEPFADVSQIPTFFVSQLAKTSVSVVLSGDGGDEVFAGYTRYLWSYYYSNKIKIMPKIIRKNLGKLIQNSRPETLNKLINLLPNRFIPPQASDRIKKIGSILSSDNSQDVYDALTSQWQDPYQGIINNFNNNEAFKLNFSSKITDVCNMQVSDLTGYLPNDILTKLDRASMAVSLEARVPLIDHRLIEKSLNLPDNLKIDNGKGKQILRKMLSKYIPTNLTNRPKQGFTVPLNDWLKGPLIEWAEDLLSEDKINREGYFNYKQVSQYWKEHKQGIANRQNQLWSVLMFQSWLSK